MKRVTVILLVCVLVLATGCQNKTYVEAKKKLVDYCRKFPTSFYSENEKIYQCDVTRDGTKDLCTDVFFGSGMPRNAVVVYDYVNDKFYILEGFPDDYYIDGCRNNYLRVLKISGEREIPGTVKFENDTLVFVSN